MGVRIGVSLGAAGTPAGFAAAVDLLEASRTDSLWLPETVYGPALDPFTGLTFALARTEHLKAGTGVSVLPGRHPVLVAKQLTSMAGLFPGRVLPAFGLQPATPGERALFGVPGPRGAVFDEALTLLRLMLTQPSVTFHGTYFSVTDASAGTRPPKPLDLWLGGSAPGGLRRVGRLADGWLGSFMPPAEAGRAVAAINAAAAEAGRAVEPDHFGMNVLIGFGPVPDAVAAAVRRRRPDLDPGDLIADGWAGARARIAALTSEGLSKFVVRPADPATPLEEFIAGFNAELAPLQT